MSRYVIWTEDENLEVFTGFEEGTGCYFLTIADVRTCTGEAGSYLFHNYDHHPSLGMTLAEVASVLARFELSLPATLHQQLEQDGGAAQQTAKLHDAGEQQPGDLTWQRAC